MTVLAIAPRFNTPGKNDAVGAFLPEARAFAKLHGGKVFTFDNRAPGIQRFVEVIDYLAPLKSIEVCAFFCHGLKHALQPGVTLRNVHVLAAALRGARSVPLYACDTARDNDSDDDDDIAAGVGGAGGMASALSAALGAATVVDAHCTTAHTTKNPHVRRFRGGGDGAWLVEPRSSSWKRWKALLRDDREFRLSFPMWSEAQLAAEMAKR